MQLCSPPELHPDSKNWGGRDGGGESVLKRSKDAAGHLGRRRKVREEKRNPIGKSLTSPGARSLLPAGRLGLNLCVPASLRPTAATAAVRRRALPPVSKEPIGTRGVVWTPAFIGFLPHAGVIRTSPCPVCSVSGSDNPSYLSRVKPASQVCFRAPWNVALPRSLSSFQL